MSPLFSCRLGLRGQQLSTRLIRLQVRRAHQSTPAKDMSSQAKPENAGHALPSPAVSGSSWLRATGQHLMAPFRAYGRVSARRPLTTQFISSLVVYSLGDLSSQYITQRGLHPDAPGAALADNYQPDSTLRALCIGAILSIPSYKWFIYLSTHFAAPAWMPFNAVASLASRVVVNQCVFAPLINVYFFSMQALLSGAGGPENLPADATVWDRLALSSRLDKAKERVINTVPTSWINGWKFWPFVTGFSFAFIPMRHRSIFVGFAAVVWQSYLCLLNSRQVAQEAQELLMGA